MTMKYFYLGTEKNSKMLNIVDMIIMLIIVDILSFTKGYDIPVMIIP